MKTIVALGLGIVIGAGGMWFMQKSNEKTLQVDEVIETYSTPMTGDNQPTPDNTAPESKPTTTGSLEGQINLSDASNSNAMGNVDSSVNNGANQASTSVDNAQQSVDNAQQSVNDALNNSSTNPNNNTNGTETTTPSQSGY